MSYMSRLSYMDYLIINLKNCLNSIRIDYFNSLGLMSAKLMWQ